MKNGRYLVIKFPMREYDVATVKDWYDHVLTRIDNTYPTFDEVIIIPHDFSWMELSKEELRQMRDMINTILESKNDTYEQARARIEDSDREI